MLFSSLESRLYRLLPVQRRQFKPKLIRQPARLLASVRRVVSLAVLPRRRHMAPPGRVGRRVARFRRPVVLNGTGRGSKPVPVAPRAAALVRLRAGRRLPGRGRICFPPWASLGGHRSARRRSVVRGRRVCHVSSDEHCPGAGLLPRVVNKGLQHLGAADQIVRVESGPLRAVVSGGLSRVRPGIGGPSVCDDCRGSCAVGRR